MSLIDIILLAIALGIDCLVVSFSHGLCFHENRVKNAVGDIKGVKSVSADHEACKVNVEFKKDVDETVVNEVKEAIERLDFKVEE